MKRPTCPILCWASAEEGSCTFGGRISFRPAQEVDVAGPGGIEFERFGVREPYWATLLEESRLIGSERVADESVGGTAGQERPDDIGRPEHSVTGVARNSLAGETGSETSERVTVDGDSSGAAAGGSKEFNQSLARLEMNSLEVKHFLDSIEQRISRMEPRLDEIRGVGDRPPAGDAALPRAEVEGVSGLQDSPPGIDAPGAFHDPPAAPGPTTERRRRAQGLPVERRRAPHAVPVVPDEKEPWDRAEMLAFMRRRRIPMGVTAALVVAVLASVAFRGRPRSDAPHQAEKGVTAPTMAAGDKRPKSSAEIPMLSAEPFGQSVTRAAARTSQATGPPHVIEQGVAAPPSSAAPARRATSGQEDLTSTAAPDATLPSPTPDVPGSTNGAVSGAGDRAEAEIAPTGTTSSARVGSLPTSRRINVSSGVMAGNLLYSTKPPYPKGIAGLFHVQGEVVMQAIISKKGRVQNVRVVSGHYMLRGAAKDAVRTWRYRPYLVNGAPVEVATIVTVEFRK